MRLALALQQRGQEAIVINADSAQVYRDLAVLSARPTAEDMQGIAHHLFGEWDGRQACSAADWAAAARREIAQAHARSAVPIIVGGTGLYIRTLLDGIAPVPEIDPAVRQAVRALPTPDAYAALSREDPQRAQALAPADTARITRALEVMRSTGRALAEWQADMAGGIAPMVTLHPAILLPPRDVLYQRCDQRFAAMIERGALDEVAALVVRKLDPALPVMRAIGVAELAGHLAGTVTLEQAVAQGSQSTRNYAKRQYTWFRRQPPAEWPRHSAKDYDIDALFEILLQH